MSRTSEVSLDIVTASPSTDRVADLTITAPSATSGSFQAGGVNEAILKWRSTFRVAIAVFAGTLASARLQAQVNPDSVKLRNDCRFAEQVLATGEPATHRQDALTTIGLCGQEGIPALISVWSSVGAKRAELELLVTSTRSFANQQIVDALFSNVTQPARPAIVRVAALMVLITFADPAIVPGFDDFLGDSTQLLRRRYGGIDHPFPW